jgi:hypothetical protein
MDTTQERLFVGSKKIIWYNIDGDEVEFRLDDGSSDIVTEAQFKAIARPSRYDDGMKQVYKWNEAVSEIMEILLKNRMKLIEKDFVTGRIDATIIQGYQKAAAKLFGAKFEEFINLAQIDSVLKENNMTFNEEEVVEEVAAPEAPAEEVVVEEAPAPEVAAE